MRIENSNGISVVLPQGPTSSVETPSSAQDIELLRQATPVSSNGSSASFISAISQGSKAKYQASFQNLTFDEYLNLVKENPRKYLRPIAQYVVDAIDYTEKIYGSRKVKLFGEELTDFAFLKKPWEPEEIQCKENFYGQLRFWNKLYQSFKKDSKLKTSNKMKLIHGPFSTGKSHAIEHILFKLLEFYSRTDEGALFTYNWIFDDKLSEFGFQNLNKKQKKYDPIDPQDVLVTIPADKKSMPFFLLNQMDRVNFLNEVKKEKGLPEDLNIDFILEFKPDVLSKKIYEALWKMEDYEGDPEKIFRHIRVVRWYMSKDEGKGLVIKQPQDPSGTEVRQITPDVDWNRLPLSIKSAISTAGISSIKGVLASANHGTILYDDGFKGNAFDRENNPRQFLRLLEKGETTIEGGVGSELFDILHILTTNDATMEKLNKDGDDSWITLKTRIEPITLGHEISYKRMSEYYKEKLSIFIPPNSKRRISPHVTDTLGLFTVMTALIPPSDEKHYASLPVPEDTRKVLLAFLFQKNIGLSLLEKALLYQGEDLNGFPVNEEGVKFSLEAQKLLQDNAKHISEEYDVGVGTWNFNSYEGCEGFQPRDGDVLLSLATERKPKECFSVVELFELLDLYAEKESFSFEKGRNKLLEVIKNKMGKDKNLPFYSNTPSPKVIINELKEYEKRKTIFDVRCAVGAYQSNDEIIKTITQYIHHIRGFSERNKIPIVWRLNKDKEAPDEKFMTEIEETLNINLSDSTSLTKYRKSLMGKLGSWAINNQGQSPFEKIHEVFPELVDRIKRAYIEKNSKKVKEFIEDLEKWYANNFDIEKVKNQVVDQKRIDVLKDGIKKLEEMGYCTECMAKMIFPAFKEKQRELFSNVS